MGDSILQAHIPDSMRQARIAEVSQEIKDALRRLGITRDVSASIDEATSTVERVRLHVGNQAFPAPSGSAENIHVQVQRLTAQYGLEVVVATVVVPVGGDSSWEHTFKPLPKWRSTWAKYSVMAFSLADVVEQEWSNNTDEATIYHHVNLP